MALPADQFVVLDELASSFSHLAGYANQITKKVNIGQVPADLAPMLNDLENNYSRASTFLVKLGLGI
jgi:hypothetical protein